MAVYWITFRLHENASRQERYDELMIAIRTLAVEDGRWWVEPTSFVLFESSATIDEVAQAVNAAISPTQDLALVGMPEFKSARAIGAIKDEDLFGLMPFTKKLV